MDWKFYRLFLEEKLHFFLSFVLISKKLSFPLSLST